MTNRVIEVIRRAGGAASAAASAVRAETAALNADTDALAAAASASAAAASALSVDAANLLTKTGNLAGLSSPAAALTNLGATTTGSALFTASTPSSGRTAISAAPLPQVAAGIGQIMGVYANANTAFVVPAGGQWVGRYLRRNQTTLGVNFQSAGIYTGGTNLLTTTANEDCFGDFWRIS